MAIIVSGGGESSSATSGRKLITSYSLSSKVNSFTLTGLSLTIDKEYEIVMEVKLSRVTLVVEQPVMLTVNNDAGTTQMIKWYGSSVVSLSLGAIVLGYVANYTDKMGLIVSRLKIVNLKPTFMNRSLPDNTSSTSSNSTISTATANVVTNTITSLNFYLNAPETFNLGTSVKIYEL